ncbi:MAG TPA: hypothetical protein VGE98_08640 [Thermoanaerobaculia bacterium]
MSQRSRRGLAAAAVAAALLLSPACSWATDDAGLDAASIFKLKQHVDNPGQTAMKDHVENPSNTPMGASAPPPAGGAVDPYV